MSEENYKEKKLISKAESNLTDSCKEAIKVMENRNKKVEEDPDKIRIEMEKRCAEAKSQAEDTASLRYIGEYKKAIGIFVENIDLFRKIFAKTGNNKIELNLYFVKIKHPCFHTDLNDNAVASDISKSLAADVSYVWLSVGLIEEWKKLKGKLIGVRDLQDLYLREFFFDDLFESLKKNKEQLKFMKGVTPDYFSELKFNVPPHLNIEIAWELEGSSSGLYYSDILTKREERKHLLPITVEGNKAECVPILVPALEEDTKNFSIDQLMGDLERRLSNVGGEVKVDLKSKVTIPTSTLPNYLLCESFMTFVRGGKEDKLPLDFIKSIIAEEVICNIEAKITAGVEHHSGGGDIKEIGKIAEKRECAWTVSDLLKRRPLNGECVPVSEGLIKKYVKEFKAFKERTLQ